MSKFTFKYVDEESGDKIIHTVTEECGDDVVRRFYDFLLGVSFNHKTILDQIKSKYEKLVEEERGFSDVKRKNSQSK